MGIIPPTHTTDSGTYEQMPHKKRYWPKPLTIILIILAFLALMHLIAVLHPTNHAEIHQNSCQNFMHSVDYTQYVSVSKNQHMSAVQFIDGLTGGQPTALIQVNEAGPRQTLDVYIYGCVLRENKPTLSLLFNQKGLDQGTVDITQAHTLSLGQMDTTLSAESDNLLLPLQENVYREYEWQHNAFQEVEFAGLYPVRSRSEGEALQDQENNGETLPWDSPLQTAQQMAQDLFQWQKSDTQGTIKDNNGIVSHVLLQRQHPNFTVMVTLSRLIKHNDKGLWFVTAAQTVDITFNKGPQAQVSSPLKLNGDIKGAVSQITATLFDHTLSPIQITNSPTVQLQSDGTYTGQISFTNKFPDQPGLLLIQSNPDKNSNEMGRLLLTNIILK